MSCHNGIKEEDVIKDVIEADDESGSVGKENNEDSRSRMRSGTTDSGYWGLRLEDMLAVAEASDGGDGLPSSSALSSVLPVVQMPLEPRCRRLPDEGGTASLSVSALGRGHSDLR